MSHGKVPDDGKYTVQDIIQMLKICIVNDIACMKIMAGNEETKYRLKELHSVLHYEQILADLEKAATIEKHPDLKRSHEILAIPSDSLSSCWAVNGTTPEEKEELVEREVYNTFLLRLKGKAVVNSSFKKPPKPFPLPPPSLDEKLQEKTMVEYFKIYGKDKPRPNYPILPPRDRPPPVEPEPKKKKGKKGKKGKKKKEPPPPINVTDWRKENLPVASTGLWLPWFRALTCHQRTPNLSNPPSPPSSVPEPYSEFGYFITMLPDDRKEKRVKTSGHYSPKHYDSASLLDVRAESLYQKVEDFPSEYQPVIKLERSKSQPVAATPKSDAVDESYFKKYDLQRERMKLVGSMPICSKTINKMVGEDLLA